MIDRSILKNAAAFICLFLVRTPKDGELLGLEWGMRLQVSNIICLDENSGLRCQYSKEEIYMLFAVMLCYVIRSALGKTVPEVLGTARGLRPRAVLKTEDTVFPNTDRPRPANNVYIFSSIEYFVSSFFVEFSLQPFSNLVYACA